MSSLLFSLSVAVAQSQCTRLFCLHIHDSRQQLRFLTSEITQIIKKKKTTIQRPYVFTYVNLWNSNSLNTVNNSTSQSEHKYNSARDRAQSLLFSSAVRTNNHVHHCDRANNRHHFGGSRQRKVRVHSLQYNGWNRPRKNQCSFDSSLPRWRWLVEDRWSVLRWR